MHCQSRALIRLDQKKKSLSSWRRTPKAAVVPPRWVWHRVWVSDGLAPLLKGWIKGPYTFLAASQPVSVFRPHLSLSLLFVLSSNLIHSSPFSSIALVPSLIFFGIVS